MLLFIKNALIASIIFLLSFGSFAQNEKDMSSVMNLQENSMRILEEAGFTGNPEIHTINFYIFVSFGLGTHNLARLAEMASDYNGILVLRGMKDNSLPATALEIETIREKITKSRRNSKNIKSNKVIGGDKDFGIIIDPTLFSQYKIAVVPSFVLASEERCLPGTSCAVSFDKLVGNVTVNYALEQFVKSGELSSEANALFIRGKNEF